MGGGVGGWANCGVLMTGVCGWVRIWLERKGGSWGGRAGSGLNWVPAWKVIKQQRKRESLQSMATMQNALVG